MTSQIRKSKRSYSAIDSDDQSPTRNSQRKRRPTTKVVQSTLGSALGFTRKSQLSQVTTRSVSPQQEQPSTQEPSTREPSPREASSSPEPQSVSQGQRTPSRRHLIAASKRVFFNVDFTLLEGDYRLRARRMRSIGSSKISWIYLHGVELEKKNTTTGTMERYWICKHCYDDGTYKIMSAGSTSSITEHLNNIVHRIYAPGTKLPTTDSTTKIVTYLAEQHPLQAEQWRQDFLNWITHDNISFEQAASELLRKVILGGGPAVEHLLPCPTTVRSWVMNTYHERISDVKAALVRSQSKVNLSLDAWSSPNNLSLLGIVAHWIDDDYKLKTGLLALRPVDGHRGSDIAAILLPVIETFAIRANLGAFQMDNASNNDTALQALAADIPTLDVRESRLRCLGHIINLVVKALLYGTGSSQLEKQLANAGDKEAFKIWRQRGAIGHLHNLVTYITRKESRIRNFETAQRVTGNDVTLQLIKDLGVRWNSTFAMIERALKLQPAIQRYCRQWTPADSDSYDLTSDFLDAKDWEELRHFEELLKPFMRATKRVEGNATSGTYGALWEVIPTMDYLFNKLKKHADEVTAKPSLFTDHYQHCLNHGFFKLSEYYTKIDDSRLYHAAVALNPCRRFHYFETAWKHNTDGHKAISNAKRQTRELFSEYLAKHPVALPAPPIGILLSTDLDDDDDDWSNAFGDQTITIDHELQQLRQQQQSELNRFMDATLDTSLTIKVKGLSTRTSYINEPLQWWCDHGRHAYPTLSIMAFDLFAIPGMSSECERAFSSAKRLITDERCSLKSDIIEADQCIKSWFKYGIADGQAAFTSIANLTSVIDLDNAD